MSTNYYDILGVEKTASDKDIKVAFRKLAHKHHPDKGGDETKFKEINEAYQTLSNKEKRAQYDRFSSTSSNFGGTSGFNGSGFGQGGFNMNYADFGRAANRSQFQMPLFAKIPKWAWIFLLPIIIVVAIIGLMVLFLWISLRSLQAVKK